MTEVEVRTRSRRQAAGKEPIAEPFGRPLCTKDVLHERRAGLKPVDAPSRGHASASPAILSAKA
jgi:hypothetical protein